MDIEVALTAWTNNPARLSYFSMTMQALRDNLTASRHNLTRILVCSEELTDEYQWPFEKLCQRFGVDLHYHPEPAEIGRNHNFKLGHERATYVLSTECDCHLTKPIDISDDIDFLEANHEFLMVRYKASFTTRMQTLAPGLTELAPKSSWPYSNMAHLRHRERFATLGPYAEDVGWGGQEIYMGRTISRSGFRLAFREPGVFEHIGRFAAHQDRWPKGESP